MVSREAMEPDLYLPISPAQHLCGQLSSFQQCHYLQTWPRQVLI